jgi:electron transfer flavoprotein alpha subunit
MEIKIDRQLCTGCENCIQECPVGAIEIDAEKKAVINEKCTLCTLCVKVCPENAIQITGEKKKTGKIDEYRGIWFFAETRGGKLSHVAYELLGTAKKLAEATGEEISGVLFSSKGQDKARELLKRGADRVYLVENPALDDFRQDIYVCLLAGLIEKHKPNMMLASATMIGRSFIPQVAARLKTGLTADCTDLKIDPETKLLQQIRPTYGGNLMAKIICETSRPQMATIRPKSMEEAKVCRNDGGVVVREKYEDFSTVCRVDLVSREMAAQVVDLQEAEVIVSGGRGLGEGKNFDLVRKLADALGASVGASRAAVDAGWIPYPHQVGQTGKTVKPKIYIACGISWSIQHLAGMQTSDYIIAINKDANAPIFKVANLGIVGDLFEVIPELLKLMGK